MKRDGTASDKRNAAKPAAPPPLPQTATPVDEPIAGEPQNTPSSKISTLMTEVLDKENLKRALERVKRNKGAPGIDGMTVDELSAHLKAHWPSIRAQLVAGSYCPQPVRRVEIPKPDGRKRLLGIPTVKDRFIQQAEPRHKQSLRTVCDWRRGRASGPTRPARDGPGSPTPMGAPLPPQQLRLSAGSQRPSGDASCPSHDPTRIRLGGGH